MNPWVLAVDNAIFFISPNADRFGLNILLIICLRKYQILNILFFQQDLARIHINDAETC